MNQSNFTPNKSQRLSIKYYNFRKKRVKNAVRYLLSYIKKNTTQHFSLVVSLVVDKIFLQFYFLLYNIRACCTDKSK